MKNIVFDLGRVLIDFSYDSLFEFFEEQVGRITLDEFVSKTELTEYEHGRITSAQFLEHVAKLLPSSVTKEEIAFRWNDIFNPFPEMLELMANVRKEHPVFILSNTSELHWNYLIEKYQLDQKADGLVASFEVGVMKPDKKIFDALCEKFELVPNECVFIDDLKDNAKGAEDAGWTGIHHASYSSTVNQLLQLGIKKNLL